MDQKFALAVHGGAGTIRRENMTQEAENAYRAGLRASLKAGYAVLSKGGSALDAASAAVMVLEDDILFNAGRGAVYAADGTQEMDAAVMDGIDRRAGAVAGIFGPRHPVLAARAVMEKSEHVLLIGRGALEFCRLNGVAFADPAYFASDRRLKALHDELERRRLDAADTRDDAAKHGTVGAVARDAYGNVAAATSTGGMTAKLPGRVGDSPVIGAGTWADNATCAVSATGHGEYFIRYAVGHEIAARMRYLKQDIDRAAEDVVAELGRIGGSGGVIAVDGAGNVALPFNSAGMYRGRIGADGVALIGIYQEELRA